MTRSISLLAVAGLLGLAGSTLAQDNPLARPPAWVGKWKNEQVTLELGREAGQGKGELTVGGKAYPLTVTPQADQPNRLSGSFEVDGHPFACTLTLTPPDTLELTSDGSSHVLTRVKPPAPENPLGRPATPNPLGAPSTPPAPGGGMGGSGGMGGMGGSGGAIPSGENGGPSPLADAWTGPAQRRQNGGGTWSCEIPAGFTVLNEAGAAMVVNPGLPPGQQPGAQDAALVCAIGELSPEERQQDPRALMKSEIPSLLQMLEGQGITISQPSDPVVTQINGLPTGVYQWSGQSTYTQAQLTVWMGVVVRGPRYVLVMGVVQKGKESQYLPKIKRLLASTQIGEPTTPLPPEDGGMGGGGGGGDEGR